MTSRRGFLTAAAALAAAPAFSSRAFAQMTRARDLAGSRTAVDLADDEAFWFEIQRAFDVDRTWINLNNGGVSPAPAMVIEQMIRDLRFSTSCRWITCGGTSSRAWRACDASWPPSSAATRRRWRSRATPPRRSRR